MSVEVKTPTHTQFEHSEFLCGDKQSNSKSKSSPVTFKFDNNNHNHSHRRASDAGQSLKDHWNRKRRLSSYRGDNSQHHVSGYRRKRFKSTPSEQIVLPTKFLLGGNITDPLNLNSINEEENEKTPYSSPVPTPAHRKEPINSVPFNINDPLNLESADDDICSKGSKKKKRNKKRNESQLNSQPPKEWVPSEKKKNLMEALKIEIDESLYNHSSSPSKSPKLQNLTFNLETSNKADKIVSPVIPQSSPRPRKRKRCFSMNDVRPDSTVSAATCKAIFRTSLSPSRNLDFQKKQMPKVKKQPKSKEVRIQKNPKFIHGNYNRYYGYRNPETEDDHRLRSFKREWFESKDILDIGCNVGHLTLSLARDYNPLKVVGIDIDKTLISAARKNIRHYISSKKSGNEKNFPLSNMVNYGPISAPPIPGRNVRQEFPNNIAFLQGNYVLSSDEMVDQQREEYDVILALSITKWVHLNNGDAGLKRFFRRIYNHLRPGGRLILEPQPWSSYKKKKKLTDKIFKAFQSIKLKPPQFSDYLLREVGFSTCEVVDVPFNKSKGFRRPIQLYTKPETATNSPKNTPKSVEESTTVMDNTDILSNSKDNSNEKIDNSDVDSNNLCVVADTESPCVDAGTDSPCVNADTDSLCVNADTDSLCVNADTDSPCVDADTDSPCVIADISLNEVPEECSVEMSPKLDKIDSTDAD